VIDWAWLVDHLGAIAGRTVQHLVLATIAVVVGFAISFVLAIASVRWRSIYPPVTAAAGILYTIPSLAVFAALVSVTGITLLTVEIPLVMYTFVILIRNIVAGLDAAGPDVTEAADGMGYTGRQRLWQVQVPLGVPLIVAGVRLASVSTIGLVTITATLGDSFGGLGYFILNGYHLHFPTEMYAGAVASIALAIAVDLVIVRAGARLSPWVAIIEARGGPSVGGAVDRAAEASR
jgi:osmoprotectant transport system permease protein